MNKKKLLSVLLAIVMVLTSFIPTRAVYANAPCTQHQWGSADLFEAPTCTAPGYGEEYCSICYQSRSYTVPALGHEWYVVESQQATCTNSGYVSYECARCGETKSETLATKAHSYSGYTTTVYATCTSKGTRTAKCSVCGKSITESIPEAAHKTGSYSVTTPPTDFDYGEEEATCSVCGKKVTRKVAPEGILKKGDSGSAVKSLQEALNHAGYNCGSADGQFGGKTETAIRKLQKDYGMPEDGIGWPGIQKMLQLYLEIVSIDNEKEVYKNGDEIIFHLRLTNTGSIRLVSPFVAGERYGASMETAEADASMYHCTYYASDEVLNPGDSKEVELKLSLYDAPPVIPLILSAWAYDNESPDGYEVYANDCYYEVHTEDSPAVDVPTLTDKPADPDGKKDTTGISVLKEVISPLPHSDGYREGDTVNYKITVTNNSNDTLYDVEVIDPLKGEDEDAVVDLIPILEPGESYSCGFDYTVVFEDFLKDTVITNQASATWAPAGISEQLWAHSNIVIVPISRLEGDDDDDYRKIEQDSRQMLVTIFKQVANAPVKNPNYYSEGEIIRYRITVENEGDLDMGGITVYDPLKEEDYGYIGTIESLKVGEAVEFYFDYVVTADDIADPVPYVINYAYAEIKYLGYVSTIYSEEIFAPVGKEGTDPSPKQSGKLKEKTKNNAPCSRTLNSKGEDSAIYTEHFCQVHYSTAEKVRTLAEENTVEAWQQAADLYRADIDAMYDYCYESAGNTEAKLVVRNERSLYYLQLESFETSILASTKDDLLVAKIMAGILEDKCIDFCYEIHTADLDRADSYLTDYSKIKDPTDAGSCEQTILKVEKDNVTYQQELCDDHEFIDQYLVSLIETASNEEALVDAMNVAQEMWMIVYNGNISDRFAKVDKKDRIAIFNELQSFKEWLPAREEFLKLLYPEKPATVAEEMNQLTMDRVLILCPQNE